MNAQKHSFIDVDAFYGFALEHDKSLKTAIQGNPYGLIIAYNLKTNEEKDWLAYYNYPEFGFSTLYQNTNSDILGEMYGLYSHYNFYLNNRNSKHKLQLRFAVGLGYITKPYDKITNAFNYTLSTSIAGSAYIKFNYQRAFFKNKLGFQTGISLIHFSNAAFRNPNLGLNTLAATIGVNYNLQSDEITYPSAKKQPKEHHKFGYNFIFRTGLNESKIPNSGQFPFYVATFMMGKKLNYKSTLNFGTDYFKADFLNKYYNDEKELASGTASDINHKTDRIGLFVGHDLKINKISLVTQLGYTLYSPNIYVTRIYERVGLKHQFNKHFFTELTLKLNLFRAEGLEFGFGYRL